MKQPRHSTLALLLLAGLVTGPGWQGSAMAQAAQKEDRKGSSTRHGDANVQLQIASSGGTDDTGHLLATLTFQGTGCGPRTSAACVLYP